MRKQITVMAMDSSQLMMDVEVGHDGTTCWPAEAETIRSQGLQAAYAGGGTIPIMPATLGASSLGEEVLDVLRDRLKQYEKDLDERRGRIAFLEKQNEVLQSQLERMFDTLIDKVSNGQK